MPSGLPCLTCTIVPHANRAGQYCERSQAPNIPCNKGLDTCLLHRLGLLVACLIGTDTNTKEVRVHVHGRLGAARDIESATQQTYNIRRHIRGSVILFHRLYPPHGCELATISALKATMAMVDHDCANDRQTARSNSRSTTIFYNDERVR
jgi:hypothetical protein